jgi:3-oxoacyl-[acyl-carrier-protein] synthase-3
MVSSAEELLALCGATVDDVDLYVPHQANKRIVDHAVKDLGLDPERVLMNIDRYGNTSSASSPICLA